MTDNPPEDVSQSSPGFASQNGHVRVIGLVGITSGTETSDFFM